MSPGAARLRPTALVDLRPGDAGGFATRADVREVTRVERRAGAPAPPGGGRSAGEPS
ncbi:hypothetical protein ACU686_17125 [Yinghuangia aomiensis]